MKKKNKRKGKKEKTMREMIITRGGEKWKRW